MLVMLSFMVAPANQRCNTKASVAESRAELRGSASTTSTSPDGRANHVITKWCPNRMTTPYDSAHSSLCASLLLRLFTVNVCVSRGERGERCLPLRGRWYHIRLKCKFCSPLGRVCAKVEGAAPHNKAEVDAINIERMRWPWNFTASFEKTDLKNTRR
ncbi:hypothetical protein BR93DRAFT_256892 [Coniochaeta sp. PMI_546]|nr:hypothetical protein BR93DRAFT_256892 [Coniochaeta sp. PMI_546]